ncbi:MAG: Rrf2 family transcriptional regulator [Candidatus Cloacimonetes bacterium]|nr:Rrf2 family transcriptional regulator [Candidatus Cloacimonadota bacterium]
MRFTTKCKYGLRAVLEIASKDELGEKIKRKVISKNQNIPVSYLENILILLKKGGIINSSRGVNGGYCLARPAKEISLYDIISILETKDALEECISDSGNCAFNDYCKLKLVWQSINDLRKKLLSKIKISDVISDRNSCIPCFKNDVEKELLEIMTKNNILK